MSSVLVMFLKIPSAFLRLSTSITLLVGLSVAYFVGWETLEPRVMTIFTDNMSNRTQIFETTYEMIDDYGLFGSGPGTFEAVAQFELSDTFPRWESWAHSDYLEFYLTFGMPGGALLITLVVTLAVQYLVKLSMEKYHVIG